MKVTCRYTILVKLSEVVSIFLHFVSENQTAHMYKYLHLPNTFLHRIYQMYRPNRPVRMWYKFARSEFVPHSYWFMQFMFFFKWCHQKNTIIYIVHLSHFFKIFKKFWSGWYIIKINIEEIFSRYVLRYVWHADTRNYIVLYFS